MRQEKIFFLSLYILLVEIIKSCKTNAKEQDWRDDLQDYLINDLQQYQIVLIVENNLILQKFDLYSIIPNQLNRPSLIYTLDQIQSMNGKKSLQNPSDTSFFILVYDSKNFNYEVAMNFMVGLAKSFMRPKCLIIHLKKDNDTYKELMHDFWANQFTDVTLLNLVINSNGTNHFRNQKSEIGQLHYYNMFVNGYKKELMRRKPNWFPDKTKNLFQYPMNITGLYRDRINWNLSDLDLLKVGGDLVFFKVLSKVMNFKINFTLRSDFYNFRGCRKETYRNSFFEGLVNNEIQMVVNHMVYPGTPCLVEPFLTSEIISVEWMTTAVPRKRISNTIIDMQQLFYISVANVCTLIGIVILAIVLKFDKNTWKLINIFLVILSMVTPNEPRKLREKIIFGCLLLMCLVYSIYLHTALTNVSIRKDYELRMNSLDDLVNSDLTPLMDKKFKAFVRQVFRKDVLFQKLINKTKDYSDGISKDACFEYMVDFKNVSCFAEITNPRKFENYFSTKPVTVDAKILPERWMPSLVVFFLEPGSRYVERFNNIILQLVENGLMEKWKIRTKFNLYPTEAVEQVIEFSIQLMYLLIIILTSGYFISIIVFVVEIVASRYEKQNEVLFYRRRKRENAIFRLMSLVGRKKLSFKLKKFKFKKLKLKKFKFVNCQGKINFMQLLYQYLAKK